jgi:hypothetical protein
MFEEEGFDDIDKSSEREEFNKREERRMHEKYKHEKERKEYIAERHDWLNKKYDTLITNGGYRATGKYAVRGLIQAMSEYPGEFSHEIENCFRALRSLRSASK